LAKVIRAAQWQVDHFTEIPVLVVACLRLTVREGRAPSYSLMPHAALSGYMGGTGKVVTAAGLVFAFTMASMVVSDNRAVGQAGTTIGLGLLFDTLIVRSFMTPSIAALLGRWFWWPMNVRSRSAPANGQRLSGDAGFEDVAETEVTAPLANGNGALNGNGLMHRHVYHGHG
jgi:hypothetical protein